MGEFKDTIIVATHNNVDCMKMILDAYDNYDIFRNYDVYIVETGDSTEAADFMLKEVRSRDAYHRFGYIRSKGIYDTGAYVLVYENYLKHLECLDRKVFFSHDSIIPKRKDSIESIFQHKDPIITSWYLHPLFFDCESQKQYCETVFNDIKLNPDLTFSNSHENLIFGPIFAASLKVLRHVRSNFNLAKLYNTVTCKEEQCGMERFWAIMFQTLHLELHSLEPSIKLSNRVNIDGKECMSGEYFNKFFLHRK